MDCTIRPALADDATDISAVILRALRETNANDYTDEIIARVEQSFGPDAVRALIAKRTVFVATIGNRSSERRASTAASFAPCSSRQTFRRAGSASC